MPIVTIDKKGRIQLPSKVRKLWHLKPKQSLSVSIGRDSVVVTRFAKSSPRNDSLLRDFIERPLRTKGRKITRKLLEKIENEMWMP